MVEERIHGEGGKRRKEGRSGGAVAVVEGDVTLKTLFLCSNPFSSMFEQSLKYHTLQCINKTISCTIYIMFNK